LALVAFRHLRQFDSAFFVDLWSLSYPENNQKPIGEGANGNLCLVIVCTECKKNKETADANHFSTALNR
jgi:hypothetical protein